MRKIFYYLVPCLLLFGVESCKDEDVSSPPTPTFTVDKTSGLYNATEFTFTVDQVGANSMSLLPYGVEFPSLGGISIPASSFTNGKATVKFTYGKVGTFNAVAVANNHSTDGTSIKNVYSDAKAITITSDQSSMTAFTIPGSTKTTIDQTAKTIAVVVAYGSNITTAKASFTISDLASATVGGAAQTSGSTANNFSSPVTYVVKAQNGTTTSYVVTVTVTAVEQLTSFKSFEGTATSKSAKNKVLATSLDNTGKKIVVYDTLGTPSNKFDSVTVKFELDGKFAVAKYAGKKLAQGTRLDLTAAKQIIVNSQDSVAGTTATYDVYAVAAPKLTLGFNDLNPIVTGKPTNFGIAIGVLNGTTVSAIKTTATTEVGAGVTVDSMTATGKNADGSAYSVAFTSGDTVDFTKVGSIELAVTDSNIGVTYKVVYTVKVTVLK